MGAFKNQPLIIDESMRCVDDEAKTAFNPRNMRLLSIEFSESTKNAH